jgi:ligand-binding sensor domain-containing protein
MASGQQFSIYNTGNSDLPSDNIKTIYIDDNGIKWIGTDSGLVYYNNTDWIIYTAGGDSLQNNNINDVVFQMAKFGPEIWVPTNKGASVFGIGIDGITSATTYQEQNSKIINDTIYKASLDTNAVRWFATPKGLSIFYGQNWDSLKDNTLAESGVYDMTAGPDNINYVATSRGVRRYMYDKEVDGITSESLIEDTWSGLPSDMVNAVFIDSLTNQWFGTNEGVAYHNYPDTKTGWQVFSTAQGLPSNNILSITEHPNGSMWFGTDAGISNYYDNAFTNYSKTDGLAGDTIYDIEIDLDSSLWICTNNGLTKMEMNNWNYVQNPGKWKYQNINEQTVSYFDIDILPNPCPADKSITIKIEGLNVNSIAFTDINGKVVILHDNANNKRSFRFNGLESGIYVVELKTNRGTITRKVVIL